MELSEIMKRISSNEIPHFMIWFGEEQKILELYIEQISKSYKKVVCENVTGALNQIRIKSLDKSKKVFVVLDDENFQRAENNWESVKKEFSHNDNILILRYSSINKKTKFYTQNKNECVEFVHLQSDILIKYIQRDIDLSDENCEKLISMCGNDYGRILLELDKIFHYAEVNKTFDDDTMFEELIQQSAIYSEIGDITFELTNAVLGGYPDKAIKKLDEAKRKGEPAMMIASILYTGFRNLVAYNGLGKDKKDAGKRTGLTGWQIKQCIDLNGGYSMKELIRNMILCQNVESGIKTGLIDEDIALEYLVLGCLK